MYISINRQGGNPNILSFYVCFGFVGFFFFMEISTHSPPVIKMHGLNLKSISVSSGTWFKHFISLNHMVRCIRCCIFFHYNSVLLLQIPLCFNFLNYEIGACCLIMDLLFVIFWHNSSLTKSFTVHQSKRDPTPALP